MVYFVNTNSEFIFTKNLFELSQNQALKLEKNILDLLMSTTYPWELLGKRLTSFLTEWIDSIPLAERHKGSIHPQAYLENPDQIVVLEGAVIEPFAYVSGPVIVAPGASIRHGAYVRGSVYVGPNAVVGHTSEVKGSILLNDAKAAHFAYVGDSILGCFTNLGAGTKLANLRFDHKNIQIKNGTTGIDSGLKKFGAILGNHSQTGCNAVTNPGTILCPHALVLPTSNARGIVLRRA